MHNTNSKYAHLTVPYTAGRHKVFTHNGVESKPLVQTERFIANRPLLLNLLRKFKNFCIACETLQREERRLQDMSRRLSDESIDPQEFGSGYGYPDEAHELEVAIKYRNHLESGVESALTESTELYRQLEKLLSDTIDAKTPSCFNFGVGYGHIDAVLAMKRPHCHFAGIDRSAFTKQLNDRIFAGIPNLEFLAGDVFDVFKKRRFDGGVFLTTRTLVLLPKKFIRDLYAAVAEAGFSKIITVEQIGISRATGRPYLFSDQNQPSEIFRSGMFLHNYPFLMEEAGYTITRSELFKTNHPHPDFRFVSLTGIR